MSPPERLLADTSVLIEPPTEEEIEAHEIGDSEWAISSLSLAELHQGVLLARADEQRRTRLKRLATVEARHEALAFDSSAARVLGGYMAEAKVKRRALRARDAIIAATAEANALAVLTRDRDFDRFGVKLVVLGAS